MVEMIPFAGPLSLWIFLSGRDAAEEMPDWIGCVFMCVCVYVFHLSFYLDRKKKKKFRKYSVLFYYRCFPFSDINEYIFVDLQIFLILSCIPKITLFHIHKYCVFDSNLLYFYLFKCNLT